MVSHCSICLLGADPPGASTWPMLVPILVIGLLFYFIMLRPDRKKREDVAKMQANLKKNDRVVTIGGIVGVVVNAPNDAEEITLRVDESTNARMRVLRSAISRIVNDGDGKETN